MKTKFRTVSKLGELVKETSNVRTPSLGTNFSSNGDLTNLELNVVAVVVIDDINIFNNLFCGFGHISNVSSPVSEEGRVNDNMKITERGSLGSD